MPLLTSGSLLLSGCSTFSPKVEISQGGHSEVQASQTEDAANSRISVEAVAHFATALTYDLDGRQAEALQEYAQAAAEDPGYEPVVIETARRYLRAREPEKAVSILKRASKEEDASGAVFTWLGLAYGQADQPEEAIKANKLAIKRMPASLAAYQNLSQIFTQTGQTNEALAVLDQAASQTSVSPGYLIDLADLNDRHGRSRSLDPETVRHRVTELLDRASDLKPENPIILQRLGDGYVKIGESDKAEQSYLRLLDRFSGMLAVRSKLADLYLRGGNPEKARTQLEEIAKRNPTNARTQAVLGMMALDANEITNAVQYLERAVVLAPDFENVYYDLARANLVIQKPEDALKILSRAASKFKTTFILNFYSGMAYASMQRYKEAVAHFLSAELLAKNQDNGPMQLNRQFYFQVGSAHERNGDHEQAATYFEKCLEISPDFPDALNYLGYMWADLGINLERARDLIEKAVKLRPETPAFLDSLAWVLFKLDRPDEALPHMLKAVELTENPDPVLYDHLGDIYDSLEALAHSRARDAWKKSLSAEEDPKVREKLDGAPSAE